MSKDDPSVNTIEEIAQQLGRLGDTLRSVCHSPECKLTQCPEQCNCHSSKLKRLNIHTAIVWTAARECYNARNVFRGWRQDMVTLKHIIMALRRVFHVLEGTSQYHTHDDKRIGTIVKSGYLIAFILYSKLCTGRYEYGDKVHINTHLDRIKKHNLRKKG